MPAFSAIWAGLKLFAGSAFASAQRAWQGLSPRAKAIALGVVAAIILFFVHQHIAHRELAAADKSGYDRAKREDEAAARKIEAQARAVKQKIDTLNNNIISQERGRYDQDVIANHTRAGALRVRVWSQVQPGGNPGANLPGAAAAAGASGGPQPQVDAGLVGPLASVPAIPLINYAEQCDDDHAARVRIEDAWKKLQQNWPSH